VPKWNPKASGHRSPLTEGEHEIDENHDPRLGHFPLFWRRRLLFETQFQIVLHLYISTDILHRQFDKC
jgi:hypothetical protein